MLKYKLNYCNPSDLLKDDKTLIIDVRNYDYNEGGHFIKAINIPIDEISSDSSLAVMKPYNKIITYCMYSQQRGPAAAIELQQIFPEKEILVCCGGFIAVSTCFPDMISQD